MTQEQIQKIYDKLKRAALGLSEQDYSPIEGYSPEFPLAEIMNTLMKMEECYPFLRQKEAAGQVRLLADGIGALHIHQHGKRVATINTDGSGFEAEGVKINVAGLSNKTLTEDDYLITDDALFFPNPFLFKNEE